MALLLSLLGAVVLAEVLIGALIHWLRRSCPWLITARDLRPEIDRDGLARFLAHGWDPELGWIRKPDTAHDEVGAGGARTRYHIDACGARRNPGFENLPPAGLAFGDSYTFSRQVNDDQAWLHLLSRQLGINVANFGVGNYGLDQALLRMEREIAGYSPVIAIMGVVPETICRVLSQWKHFSEYGNVFAFKPSFVTNGEGTLTQRPNPVDTPDKFHRIAELMPELQRADYFYEHKFKRDLLRFPYLWSVWRSRSRALPLISAALADRMGGHGKRAFMQVMERNIAITASLYREPAALELMVALARRFADLARRHGAEPILVMLPQLYDLHRLRAGDAFYAPFLARIAAFTHTVDLAPQLLAQGATAGLYIDDAYGGHLSARGNEIAAEVIAAACRAAIAQGRDAALHAGGRK